MTWVQAAQQVATLIVAFVTVGGGTLAIRAAWRTGRREIVAEHAEEIRAETSLSQELREERRQLREEFREDIDRLAERAEALELRVHDLEGKLADQLQATLTAQAEAMEAKASARIADQARLAAEGRAVTAEARAAELQGRIDGMLAEKRVVPTTHLVRAPRRRTDPPADA